VESWAEKASHLPKIKEEARLAIHVLLIQSGIGLPFQAIHKGFVRPSSGESMQRFSNFVRGKCSNRKFWELGQKLNEVKAILDALKLGKFQVDDDFAAAAQIFFDYVIFWRSHDQSIEFDSLNKLILDFLEQAKRCGILIEEDFSEEL
jgi:hypothetical protein